MRAEDIDIKDKVLIDLKVFIPWKCEEKVAC